MKKEVKKLDASKVEIAIAAEGEVVKTKFEEVFARISQQAKIKGFRPGHAPRDILEKEYSALAHEQVLKELIPQLYDQAVKESELAVLDLPQINEVKLDRANISFKAVVEVTPETGVKNYRGLPVSYAKVAVTSDEVKRAIDSYKESRKVDAIDDAFARSIGYPTLAELEASVERQLAVKKDNDQRSGVERQIIEALTKGLDFKLPQSLVAKQLEELVRQAKVELAMRGIPREEIAGHEQKMRQELEPQARSQVKTYLVLSEIAKKENIPADDHTTGHAMEFLLREAAWKVSDEKKEV